MNENAQYTVKLILLISSLQANICIEKFTVIIDAKNLNRFK